MILKKCVSLQLFVKTFPWGLVEIYKRIAKEKLNM